MASDRTIKFEYKGFTSSPVPNAKDRNRLYGTIIDPDTGKACEDRGYAADNLAEAEERFQGCVRQIIAQKSYALEVDRWKERVDWKTVASVYNILPDIFRQRALNKEVDTELLQHVEGGDYAVPLHYITKAWDYILKGSLGHWAWFIGPEEEIDFSEESLQEFLKESNATRTRNQAVEDNEKMKAVWAELFGIDIDALEIDFSKFDMHFPPHVTEEESMDYFWNVLDGVNEWVLGPVNDPDPSYALPDCTSALMEFACEMAKDCFSEEEA